jgi:hypothetical protein
MSQFLRGRGRTVQAATGPAAGVNGSAGCAHPGDKATLALPEPQGQPEVSLGRHALPNENGSRGSSGRTSSATLTSR